MYFWFSFLLTIHNKMPNTSQAESPVDTGAEL